MANVQRRISKNGEISFYIRVLLEQKPDGSQKFKGMTWKPDKKMTESAMEKKAWEQAGKFEDSIRNGTVSIKGNVSFAEIADRWLEVAEIAYLTKETYGFLLIRIKQEIGHIRIDKLQSEHLENFYKKLREDGAVTHTRAIGKDIGTIMKKQRITQERLSKLCGVGTATIREARRKNPITLVKAKQIAEGLSIPVERAFTIWEEKRPLSSKTILHHHAVISAILAYAKMKKLIPYNVATEHMKAPKVERKEAKYLTDEQARYIVELLLEEPDPRIKTAILLLLYSGVRRGELCGLSWADIDWANNMIHIKRASQYQRMNGIKPVLTKNKSSVRPIKLSPIVFSILKQYRGWWSEQKLTLGDKWQAEEERLFIQWNGKPLNPNTIGGWLKKFREKHNLPHFTPHSCRHTFATLQISAGVDIRTLQARTGHAQASTLIDIYSHALNSAAEAASNALGDILTPDSYKQNTSENQENPIVKAKTSS